MSDLAKRECVPCKGGVPALEGEDLARLREELGHDWDVVDDHHLTKTFAFPDFASALAYVPIRAAAKALKQAAIWRSLTGSSTTGRTA